jgi:hypothetical protein
MLDCEGVDCTRIDFRLAMVRYATIFAVPEVPKQSCATLRRGISEGFELQQVKRDRLDRAVNKISSDN